MCKCSSTLGIPRMKSSMGSSLFAHSISRRKTAGGASTLSKSVELQVGVEQSAYYLRKFISADCGLIFSAEYERLIERPSSSPTNGFNSTVLSPTKENGEIKSGRR